MSTATPSKTAAPDLKAARQTTPPQSSSATSEEDLESSVIQPATTSRISPFSDAVAAKVKTLYLENSHLHQKRRSGLFQKIQSKVVQYQPSLAGLSTRSFRKRVHSLFKLSNQNEDERENQPEEKKTKTNEIGGAQKAPSANVAPLLPNEVVTNSSTALRTASIPNCRSCTKAKKKCNKNGKGSTNPDCAFWNPLKDLQKTKKKYGGIKNCKCLQQICMFCL